ncbi:CpaF family protein [Virgibacillus oceani]|uniref:Type II secretion system protein E n=1 Tax=Virgibacillus oceani TaxID=1479511 RepID=A0A917HF85_9BACI|nr:ATPase, T2SS/T4P/T4SS family [Virgibacillus oceani]GGG76608.1 type II secretion system protein E [Virgibacillus oceani]
MSFVSGLGARLYQFLTDELNQSVNQGEVTASLIEELAGGFLDREGNYLTFAQKKQLINEAASKVIGYGPLFPYLSDPHVNEIMVNGPKDVYINVNGNFEKAPACFRNDAQVMHVIDTMASQYGLRIDESSPIMDAALSDGSHIHAIIPPLARYGPVMTIRKFIKPAINDLIRMGTLNEVMADFLKTAVEAKRNIFVIGEAGSGKTTTLNALSSFIPENERIVTIEDSAELNLTQDHVVSLEANSRVSIYDLVQSSARMCPDRIVVSDVQGSEIVPMLQAMNTGQIGSLGTGYAGTPRELLAEFEMVVLKTEPHLSIRAIREQLAGALDLIVQQTRMKDGTRKITRITEVQGLDRDTIVLRDIFTCQDQQDNYQYCVR